MDLKRNNNEILNNEIWQRHTDVKKLDRRCRAFTLSEAMAVLVVLGIVAALTIPQVVRRQIEAANRTKIKKSMKVFDLFTNKIVVENDLKNNTALHNWATKNDCENSLKYFKPVKFIPKKDGTTTNCRFMTSDKVAWDLSNYPDATFSLKEADLDKEDSPITFKPHAHFDGQGILRVNDLGWETANGTAIVKDIEKMLNPPRVELVNIKQYTICKECTIRYIKNGLLFEDEYKEDKLISSKRCSKSNKPTSCITENYDTGGNIISKNECGSVAVSTCKTTNYRYENGKMTEVQICSYDNTCYISEKNTYSNGLLVKVESCDEYEYCRIKKDNFIYSEGELISYRNHDSISTYYDIQSTVTTDGAGNTVKTEEKLNKNGTIVSSEEITYLGDSDNILKKVTYSSSGNGTQTEINNTYENGKIVSSRTCKTGNNVYMPWITSTSCTTENYTYSTVNNVETKTTTNDSEEITSIEETYYDKDNNIVKYCVSCTLGLSNSGGTYCDNPSSQLQCISIDN